MDVKSQGRTPSPNSVHQPPSLSVSGWYLRFLQLRLPPVNPTTTCRRRQREWVRDYDQLWVEDADGRSCTVRLPSNPSIYRWYPDTCWLFRLTEVLWSYDTRWDDKRRSGCLPLAEPLPSPCYVFNWHIVLLLPHPPICVLGSHAEHRYLLKDVKTQRESGTVVSSSHGKCSLYWFIQGKDPTWCCLFPFIGGISLCLFTANNKTANKRLIFKRLKICSKHKGI